MNTVDLNDLKLLLSKRISIIEDHTLRDSDPESHLSQLQQVSEAISYWSAEHKNALDPQLQHFLTNCSYAKALKYISVKR